MTNHHSFTSNEHVCAAVNRKQRVGGFIYRKRFGGRKAMAECKKEDMALCVIVSKCLSVSAIQTQTQPWNFRADTGYAVFPNVSALGPLKGWNSVDTGH